MTLFYCGWPLVLFAEQLFFDHPIKWARCDSSKRRDILVFGAHGPCDCDPVAFLGVLVMINGEDEPPLVKHPRMVLTGAGGMPFAYGAVEWINRNMSKHRGPVTQRAVAYANSNCVQTREAMAAKLAAQVPVHAYGLCNARGKAINARQASHWAHNTNLFRGYAFVFAAEHGQTTNYVTEKPFVAAAAGAVPIYWGDSLVASYLNPRRMLMWSDATVGRVAAYLKNGDELAAMRSLPAVNTTAIIRSMGDLRRRVRALLRRAAIPAPSLYGRKSGRRMHAR